MTTTSDELIVRIKAAIASSKSSLKDAADGIATLYKQQNMSQRDIADAVGKSVGWVNAMLNWQVNGCKGDSPFGPTTGQGRRSATEQKKAKRSNVVQLATPAPKSEPEQSTPEAKPTPAPPPASAPLPAPTSTPETEQVQAMTGSKPSAFAEIALREFKLACEKWLRIMTDAEHAEAVQFVNEIVAALFEDSQAA